MLALNGDAVMLLLLECEGVSLEPDNPLEHTPGAEGRKGMVYTCNRSYLHTRPAFQCHTWKGVKSDDSISL